MDRMTIGAIILWIAVLSVTCFSTVTTASEDIRGFTNKERPKALFDHDQHMQLYECSICHHDYENGKNVLDESTLTEENPAIRCASCHANGGKANLDLRRAFHNQCIGCHHKLLKESNVLAPRLCGECHKKQTPKGK